MWQKKLHKIRFYNRVPYFSDCGRHLLYMTHNVDHFEIYFFVAFFGCVMLFSHKNLLQLYLLDMRKTKGVY